MTAILHKFGSHETIESEARQWLIRLDGDKELSQPDLEALSEWVERSPAHRAELLRISAFWRDASILTELSIPLRSKTGRRGYEGPAFFKGMRLSYKSLRALAAACVLGLGLALTWWFYPQSITATNGIYATAIGELRAQTLADGSIMQINTDSQVQVEYRDSVRKIRLLRGEAHFNVTHNPAWPFEVYAGKGMIKATGTAFSVRLTQDKIKVTVDEGRVDLSAMVEASLEPLPGEPPRGKQPAGVDSRKYQPALEMFQTLSLGQSATFSNRALRADQRNNDTSNIIKELNTLPKQELDRQMSWREGYLVFAGHSLSQVVDEVNRYTPITIEIADPDLGKLRIGGRFKVGELDAMFDVLETSFAIRVSRLDDQHIQLLPAQL